MKLSDYKGEDALELLADILEPAAEIFGDKELGEMYKGGVTVIQLVAKAIKKHKGAVLAILAAAEGKSADEYDCNVLTLPAKIMELLNDKELKPFFTVLAGQNGGNASGSATENTEETEKE